MNFFLLLSKAVYSQRLMIAIFNLSVDVKNLRNFTVYKNIGSYGLIGDMHSVALVSGDGSIDYCAMPHIDSPTVFAALLDDRKGGRFGIAPDAEFESSQQYVTNTNILKIDFETKTGRAELVDFMPAFENQRENEKHHSINRLLRLVSGSMDFELVFDPRPDYARTEPEIKFEGSKIFVESQDHRFILNSSGVKIDWSRKSNGLLGNLTLKEGQQAALSFSYDREPPQGSVESQIELVTDYWRQWLNESVGDKIDNLGEYAAMACRSLLVLKLLTFEPTGAIAAAATTSLPEAIGAERNWDYRFTWLRDASLTLKAFFSLGHIKEVERFIHFLHETYRRYGGRKLQIMYSLEGESDITEKTLDHLEGYEDSRPVRIGNEAYKQNQWDIYGEVMDSALRLSDYAGRIDEDLWPFFRDICDLAIENYADPDSGIWEVRSGDRHFVYSKVMCWVAIDRGIKIAKRYGFEAPMQRWQDARRQIKKRILDKGYVEEINSLVQYFGSRRLDASLLLIGLMDFLSVDDKRIQGTIAACQNELMRGDFLARYNSADGLQGEEGAFILCNFWLIEMLARSGRQEQARRLLLKTAEAGNHLGLFAEEYDTKNGRPLGNFPQAFSHIGFINAAVSLTSLHNKRKKHYYKWIIDFFRRKAPFRVTLNHLVAEKRQVTGDVAAKLKKSLNELQGAFFDIERSRVDYGAMKKSQSFRRYVELTGQLKYFDPSTLETDAEKKAFWINIYNILVIHAVCHYNVNKSVRQVSRFFSRIGYDIGGFFFSADDVEHGILRANSPKPGKTEKRFKETGPRAGLSVNRLDFRIHFALVCAASSCPPIEFYDPKRIDRQLDLAGKSFLNRRGMTLDKNHSTLYLSRIFDWYAEDFGGSEKEQLDNILKYAREDIKQYVRENRGGLNIRFHRYDWNLNRTLG